MAQSGELDIDHIADLARIALTPEEKARFSAQLGEVLVHIAQLREANVTGVEPTAHAFPIFNVLAEDTAQPGLPVESALQNAPARRDNLFVVPKMVE
jgi:aspartyl-tRNA(Asn)/glutamyl-tRNA(Gln) amidotransferase subunit C